MYQDNQSAILLENNGKKSSSKRTRHINIRYYFITDRIKNGKLEIEYCPTDDMVADYFTKPLQGKSSYSFARPSWTWNLDSNYSILTKGVCWETTGKHDQYVLKTIFCSSRVICSAKSLMTSQNSGIILLLIGLRMASWKLNIVRPTIWSRTILPSRSKEKSFYNWPHSNWNFTMVKVN